MRQTLETDRLELKPLTLSDAPRVSELAGNINVARMTGSIGLPYLPLAAEMWIMVSGIKTRQGRLHLYGIFAKTTGWLIGTIALFPKTPYGQDIQWEIGYLLGEPYWGQGFMREAVTAVLTEADACFPGQILHAGVYHDNPKSLNLLKEFGFEVTDRNATSFSMARGTSAPLTKLTRPMPLPAVLTSLTKAQPCEAM